MRVRWTAMVASLEPVPEPHWRAAAAPTRRPAALSTRPDTTPVSERSDAVPSSGASASPLMPGATPRYAPDRRLDTAPLHRWSRNRLLGLDAAISLNGTAVFGSPTMSLVDVIRVPGGMRLDGDVTVS